MPENLYYIFILLTLIIVEIAYFAIANRNNIVDEPNVRGSHTNVTIRGGGIIFPVSLLLHTFFVGFQYTHFIIGLMMISLISFFDDLRSLSSTFRLFGHLLAVSLLFMQTSLIGFPLWVIGISYVCVIGTINAYNFMDGINGITGSYSIVTIFSLYWVNEYMVSYVPSGWLLVSLLGLLVFNFFNFRIKAKCFAGDVGSVSIAFIIVFFLILLVVQTENLKFVFFLLIYGLDTVTTIIFRLFRRENIFKAHRSHFYQYLANEKQWHHLKVATLYAILQLLVNIFIIYSDLSLFLLLLFIILLGFAFVLLRFIVEGKHYLLESGN